MLAEKLGRPMTWSPFNSARFNSAPCWVQEGAPCKAGPELPMKNPQEGSASEGPGVIVQPSKFV